MAINCWEFKKCERKIGGKKFSELGVCPAVTATEADGFCGGKNGGRGCAYITGTFCSGTIQGTSADKEKHCFQCDFYQELKKEHGIEQSVLVFVNYVKNRKKEIK
jgi:hypothetical protein